MADKASGDKAGERNFFARTAKNTTKRAKRAQEKVIYLVCFMNEIRFNAQSWRKMLLLSMCRRVDIIVYLGKISIDPVLPRLSFVLIR